jgi:hypothetical protein
MLPSAISILETRISKDITTDNIVSNYRKQSSDIRRRPRSRYNILLLLLLLTLFLFLVAGGVKGNLNY